MKKRKHKNIKKRRIWWIAVLTLFVFCMLLWESDREGKKSVLQEIKLIQKPAPTVETDKKPAAEQKKEKKIKVLLKTEGFAGLFHKEAVITSDCEYKVSIDGKEKSYKKGEKITFRSRDDQWKGKKIMITPQSEQRLQLLSVKRQKRCPKYRGQIQLSWKKQGFLICNILPLEEYLYAVVPSELSTRNNMEALKAQAVCARSYACNQIKSHRYDEYHADVDDSVDFQVYNNIPENRRSREAVKDTRELVLTKNNEVVQTYYYSTSWGYTADGSDVWNTENNISYLQSKFQITPESRKKTGKKEQKLSRETAFLSFLNHPDCETYDSAAPWYRWSVTVGQKSLSNRIDALLFSCYSENPNLVLTQTKNGEYIKKPLKAMGLVKKIRVERREDSGLVTQVVLVGTKNVVKVLTQYNIRKVLAPMYESISYNKNKSRSRMTLLPSAAFSISTLTEGKKISFIITGGGLGHGAGLSQSGAARMAKLGSSYREILSHYFSGTELRNY